MTNEITIKKVVSTQQKNEKRNYKIENIEYVKVNFTHKPLIELKKMYKFVIEF